jgi:hypothetical protein
MSRYKLLDAFRIEAPIRVIRNGQEITLPDQRNIGAAGANNGSVAPSPAPSNNPSNGASNDPLKRQLDAIKNIP